jgi:flagellar basal-body rod protein FlgF
MDSGLYIAASGMLAEMVRQEQISNQLANVNTPGFKPSGTVQEGFAEMFLHNTETGAPVGTLSLGAEIAETPTDLTPDPLHETGEPTDFAIEGEGFFAVSTGAGTRYTRNGQFASNAEGTLVDAEGDPVLGPNGAPVKLRPDGKVPPSDLGVFEITGARQQGDNLFSGNPAGAGPGNVRAGFLEESGVNAARVMTQMISSFRSLEADQKSIQTIGETLSESAGSVGAIS